MKTRYMRKLIVLGCILAFSAVGATAAMAQRP